MSQASEGGTTTGALGKKNLTTMHAVAQALAIGPMFSVALVLGGVSRPDIGAGWNAALKGGTDRVTDSFLIAVGGFGAGALIIAFLGAPPEAAWPYLATTVCIHLAYWFCLFKGYDAGDMSHVVAPGFAS